MFIYRVLLVFTLLSFKLFSQDDLLSQLENQQDEITENTVVKSVFKSFKFVNFETTKLVPKNHLNFVVMHRFGTIKNGIDDLFGLDYASTRLLFVYGISEKVNVSFSRSKFNRVYDVGLKYSIVQQKTNNSPLSIVAYHLVGVNTALEGIYLPGLEFKHRLLYSNQLLISRKFNKNLSLELIPSYFHDNLVAEETYDNAQFAIGLGGRYQFTSRLGVILDYGYHLNRTNSDLYRNPLSIGLEIETGGHVFQLHFSNSQAMFENDFLGKASGDWSKSDIFFGFNISRDFNFASKK